jgi:hypothetical protein
MALFALIRWTIQPINGLFVFLTDAIAHLQNLNNEVLTKVK